VVVLVVMSVMNVSCDIIDTLAKNVNFHFNITR